MIDQDLKNKIHNTINSYEIKCDKLQNEISGLKNAIHQLVITPIGVHYEVDDHLKQFQQQLDTEFDPKTFEEKVALLADLFKSLHKKNTESTRVISTLIKQGVESVGRLANKPQDRSAFSKLQEMIEGEVESQAILVNFNEVLSQCVSSAIKDIEESKPNNAVKNSTIDVSMKVNESLLQLLNHLSIPQGLDSKKEEIKTTLEKKIAINTLSKIIDGLTELLVDAFNVDQNRFKGFLQQVTNQLNDFEMFLAASSETRKQAFNDSTQVGTGIQDNIEQIKNHLDSSKTIEELSSKVSQNLEIMGNRMKEYHVNEKKREEEYENQLKGLQAKLEESEQSAEEIKEMLSLQRHRINHDILTGLANRAAYDEHVLEAHQRWKRGDNDLCMAVCDIDHFKRVNDTFGHLAGDKVLTKVASIFKSSIREVDFIARVGGEEFVIIFENTSTKEAYVILENLRILIQECQFYYQESKVDVTVSFGLTCIKKEETIESLFMRADAAMYAAKNAGRNRVEVL